jgi:hypothetical protein
VKAAEFEQSFVSAAVATSVFAIGTLALLSTAIYASRRELRLRSAINNDLANAILLAGDTTRQLKREHEAASFLNQTGSLIQSCDGLEEIALMIPNLMRQIAPAHDGALYIYPNSGNELERLAAWGDVSRFDPEITRRIAGA